MHRHDVLEHNWEVKEYTMDCVTTERRLLQLCMREALLIEGQDPKLSINNKMEQGRGSLIRISASRWRIALVKIYKKAKILVQKYHWISLMTIDLAKFQYFNLWQMLYNSCFVLQSLVWWCLDK